MVSVWVVDVGSSLNSGNGIGELFVSTGLAEAPRANSSSSRGLVTVESASPVLTMAERRCVKLLDDGGTNFNVVRFVDVKSMPTSDNVFISCSVITIWKSTRWKNQCTGRRTGAVRPYIPLRHLLTFASRFQNYLRLIGFLYRQITVGLCSMDEPLMWFSF